MVLPIDLVLVRHGESEGNLAMIRGKQGDRSIFQNEHFSKKHSSLYRLTTSGITQAKAAGKWIRENIGQLDEFYVSEYIRAMETAAHLGIPQSKWTVDFMLRERDWGSKEYKSFEERLKYKHSMENRLNGFFFVPSRGESIAQICSRLMKIIQELHNKCSDRRVLIVCHDKVMRSFRVILENICQEKYREISKGFNDKNSTTYIHNCQVIHYTRRDPFTGKLSSKLKYMRSVNPKDENSPSNTGWIKMLDINRKLQVEELLKRVNAVPRIIDNTSPANLPPGYSHEKFQIPKHYETEIEEEEDDDDDSEDEDEEEGEEASDDLDDVLRGEDFLAITEEEIEEEEEEEEDDDEDEDEGEESSPSVISPTIDKSLPKETEGEKVEVESEESLKDTATTTTTTKKKKKKKKKITKLIRLDKNIVKKLMKNIRKSGNKKKKKKKKKIKKTKKVFRQ